MFSLATGDRHYINGPNQRISVISITSARGKPYINKSIQKKYVMSETYSQNKIKKYLDSQTKLRYYSLRQIV